MQLEDTEKVLISQSFTGKNVEGQHPQNENIISRRVCTAATSSCASHQICRRI